MEYPFLIPRSLLLGSSFALVRVGEGPSIFTPIPGCNPIDDALPVGQEMLLVLDKLKTDQDGVDVIGWKFKPAL